jgi:hypothetical protein
MKSGNSQLLLMSAIMLVGMTACSKVQFSPTDPNGTSTQLGTTPGGTTPGGGGPGGGQCDSNLGTTKELTKMLFIVDMSGSNMGAADCTLGPNCTDLNKKMRAGSITRFFTHYGNRVNFNWAFETFQGTTANALISSAAGMPTFSDANAMQSAITTFTSEADSGGTPYMAALNLATTTIANDPDLNGGNNPQYIVVFMSDGQPDAGDAASTILNQVNTMVGLRPGKITFNAVYYGTGDATAAGLLQSMSQIGHGNFLNTSVNPTGLDFEIDDLVQVPCP